MRSFTLALASLVLLALTSGCTTMSGGAGLEGPADPGDNPDSEWNSFGREARAGQFAEFESDGHLFDNLASPRAQSIERSLGVFR